MLKETYLAKLKKMREEHPTAIFIIVTAIARHVLAPPWGLLKAIKKGKITWEEYTKRYRAHVFGFSPAVEEMYRIKEMAKRTDVYLVCYEKDPPCHRFLLLEWIKELK